MQGTPHTRGAPAFMQLDVFQVAIFDGAQDKSTGFVVVGFSVGGTIFDRDGF